MEALCQAILGDETLLRPPPGALSQRICQAALFVDLLSEGQGRVGGEGGNVGYGGGGPSGGSQWSGFNVLRSCASTEQVLRNLPNAVATLLRSKLTAIAQRVVTDPAAEGTVTLASESAEMAAASVLLWGGGGGSGADGNAASAGNAGNAGKAGKKQQPRKALIPGRTVGEGGSLRQYETVVGGHAHEFETLSGLVSYGGGKMGEGRGVTRMMQPATGGKGSSKKEAKKKQTKSTVRVSGYSSRGLRRFDAVLVMPTAATEAATSNEKCVVSLGFVSPSGCQAVGFPVPGAAVNPRAGTWGLEIAKDGTVRTRHNGKQPGKVGAVDGTDGHMKVKDGDTISIEIDHQTRVRLDSVLVFFSYQYGIKYSHLSLNLQVREIRKCF